MKNSKEHTSVERFNLSDNKSFVIIISGPTASGKTSFADKIAEQFNGEIINADTGQFYAPFSVGTAKPDWKNSKIPQHLFDILNEPKTLTVVEYKNLILNKISEISKKGKIPILVGGSLFYLKSLYFSPKENVVNDCQKRKVKYSWDFLNKIDSKRAKEIHPNDFYRIERALNIWRDSGIKPSTLKPNFNPQFNSLLLFIKTPREILNNRILLRTELMLKHGWIEEVDPFIGTSWEPFFRKSGLIGYKEVADWIKSGKKNEEFENLKNLIVIKTRQYAKRQITFWRSFYEQIKLFKKNSLLLKVLEIEDPNSFDCSLLKIK